MAAIISNSRPTIGIIGGGISGLSCALQLEARGYKCKIFDTGKQTGGRASSRNATDHAIQFIASSPTHSSAFKTQLQSWHKHGVVQKWNTSNVIGATPATDYYIGSNARGMGAIAQYMSQSLNTPPAIDTWISPSNGLRKEGNQWKIKGHGKFDAVVIAHNGKCADRLTSKINCKRINRLLRVTFNDTPSTNKMTLNSIYSLIVEIQKDVLRKDIDGMFCSDKSQILDSMFCQNRKYATPSISTTQETQETETWTLLSNASYAKANKQPQEHLDGTKLTQTIIQTMLQEAFNLASVNKANGIHLKAVVKKTKLQLWGAGVPLNTWKPKDGNCFLWDADNQIGVVGDWLKDSSLYGAWESGYMFGSTFEKGMGSKGMDGTFISKEGDEGSALVGGGSSTKSNNSNKSNKTNKSTNGKGTEEKKTLINSSNSNNKTDKTKKQVQSGTNDNMHVLVVGAGLTGSLTAHEIRTRYPTATIDVFESARGAGGRCSTTRFSSTSNKTKQKKQTVPEEIYANTGAQYLSTSLTGKASTLMKELIQNNLMVKINNTPIHSRCFQHKNVKDFAPTRCGINDVVKYFLTSANAVRYETRLLTLKQNTNQGGWITTSKTKKGKKEENKYDAVILCMPPSNALRVLPNGDIKKQLAQQTKHVKWHSRFSLALWFNNHNSVQATEFITAASLAHQASNNSNTILDAVIVQSTYDTQGNKTNSPALVIQSTTNFWQAHRKTNAGGSRGGGGTQFGGGKSSGKMTEVTGNGRGVVKEEMIAALNALVPGAPAVVETVPGKRGQRDTKAGGCHSRASPFWKSHTNTKDEMIDELQTLVPSCIMPMPSNVKMLNWRTSQVVSGKNCVVSGEDSTLVLTGDWCYESSFEGCVKAACSAVDVCFEKFSSSSQKKKKKATSKKGVCKNFSTTGSCRYGKDCKFVHV